MTTGLGKTIIPSNVVVGQAVSAWAAVVTVRPVAVLSIFSASAGVIFGFWPARKASLLSRIEAFRYEWSIRTA